MARMKATVKRLNAAPKVNFGWKRVYPFKIRQTLPPQKTVDIKKNRQVIKLSMYEENLNISLEDIDLFFKF